MLVGLADLVFHSPVQPAPEPFQHFLIFDSTDEGADLFPCPQGRAYAPAGDGVAHNIPGLGQARHQLPETEVQQLLSIQIPSEARRRLVHEIIPGFQYSFPLSVEQDRHSSRSDPVGVREVARALGMTVVEYVDKTQVRLGHLEDDGPRERGRHHHRHHAVLCQCVHAEVAQVLEFGYPTFFGRRESDDHLDTSGFDVLVKFAHCGAVNGGGPVDVPGEEIGCGLGACLQCELIRYPVPLLSSRCWLTL